MNISESSVCVLISKGLQPDAARGASVPRTSRWRWRRLGSALDHDVNGDDPPGNSPGGRGFCANPSRAPKKPNALARGTAHNVPSSSVPHSRPSPLLESARRAGLVPAGVSYPWRAPRRKRWGALGRCLGDERSAARPRFRWTCGDGLRRPHAADDLASGDRRRASPAEDLQHLRQFHASSGQHPDRRQGLGGGYLGGQRAPRHLRRRELHPDSGRRERPQRSHSACCQGRGRSGGRSLPTGIDRSADLASGGEPDILHLTARKLCG